MGTYSTNTTIKVSSAVSATKAGSGAVYTCPANSYAILNLSIYFGSPVVRLAVISVGGVAVFSAGHDSSGNSSFSSLIGNGVTANSSASCPSNIYVGPGQSVSVSGTVAADVVTTVAGVCFINTP